MFNDIPVSWVKHFTDKGLSIQIPTCSKQRRGRFVAGCGGYWDTSPMNQQILIARLDVPTTPRAVSGRAVTNTETEFLYLD